MKAYVNKLKTSKLMLMTCILACIMMVVSCVYLVQVKAYLPSSWVMIITVLFLIIVLLLLLGTYKIPKIILGIEVLLCICLVVAGMGIQRLTSFTATITKTKEVETVQIVALKSSKISKDSDFKNLSMAYHQDDANAYKRGVEILKVNNKVIGKEKPYKTTKEAYTALKSKKVSLMVITNITQSELAEIDEVYESKIKVIFSKEYKLNSATIKEVDMSKDPFTIYIQGTDLSSGKNINSTGRGDVNILLTVNPKTKKVNMQAIPRDLFVYIPSKNASSKLSYSGWWGGIQSSISSIEKKFDIDINYYAKLNFAGLTNLVDALGGVQVYSHYTYQAGEYSFVKGYNDVQGEKALMFARARKMLPLNERSRGYQQMELIKGIFTKFSQEPTIQHGFSVLDSLESNFTTNVGKEDFIDVFNLVMDMMPQLKSMKLHSMEGEYKWHMDEVITSDYLYYFYPAKGEVQAVKDRIQNVLLGK